MRRYLFVLAPLLLTLLLAACSTGPGGQSAPPLGGGSVDLQLSSTDSTAHFELENQGERTLDWVITLSHSRDNPQGGDWFDLAPDQGTLDPGQRQLVTLTQHRGLAPGQYHTYLTVEYPGGETPFEVLGHIAGPGDLDEGDGIIIGRVETANALISSRPSGVSALQALALPEESEPADSEELLPYVPGEVIVGLKPSFEALSLQDEFRTLELAGIEVHSSEALAGDTLLIEIDPSADPAEFARQLEADPRVEYAEPNIIFRPHHLGVAGGQEFGTLALPNDPLLSESWHLPLIGAPLAWTEAGSRSDQVVVAVLDTGIDTRHEDLRNVALPGYDFCATSRCSSRDSDPTPASGDWHGTHVAGLVAAQANNGRGSAGAAGGAARIVPVKVFSNGASTGSALAQAIRWAAGEQIRDVPRNQHPAQVINLSLGAPSVSDAVQLAIEDARDRGVLVIASAGNDGESQVDFPANLSDVIGVGSVTSELRRSCFSDYGTGLDIVAPGGQGSPSSTLSTGGACDFDRNEALLSTVPGNYGEAAGTSMAAPLVSGAAALLWANNPGASAEKIRDLLLDSAYFDSSYMNRQEYGQGVLRLDRALGLPGPGDTVRVQAAGPSTDIDEVTLDPYGSSGQFRLEGLAPGSYEVTATALGRASALEGSATTTLREGRSENLVIRVGE